LETQKEIEEPVNQPPNPIAPVLLGGAVGVVAAATLLDRLMNPEGRWWWERLFYPRAVVYSETVGEMSSRRVRESETKADYVCRVRGGYTPLETFPSVRADAKKKYSVVPEKPTEEGTPVLTWPPYEGADVNLDQLPDFRYRQTWLAVYNPHKRYAPSSLNLNIYQRCIISFTASISRFNVAWAAAGIT